MYKHKNEKSPPNTTHISNLGGCCKKWHGRQATLDGRQALTIRGGGEWTCGQRQGSEATKICFPGDLLSVASEATKFVGVVVMRLNC
ncbi:hypothetical protein GUJ93_ZPchr0005g14997 [Zizania palustris]|uniref:Uncharacterized protein n=1 Tax=Zizania palustris TaxID=103762 RepID=A0A8J5T988_ZIZPA|nr:hypothetical protein GUJ93_ZPchr0005g14997 [Zizania palustris]